jgi:signal transduction histidine kinase
MVVLVIVSAALYKKRQADRRLQQKEIHILKQQQEAMQREQEIERLKAMMKGEEQGRTRLARELHDGIGGMLTAIKMNLSAARKKYPELARFDPLTEITFMLEDTGAEIRKTAHNLMPDVLVRKRLPEALMIYCEQITAHDQLQIDLQFHGAFDQLTKATELMLYRIIQELLQNILKHANATHAVVQLREYEGKLSLTVEDNGEGFDTEAQSGGFGLLNLRYRVAALQGHISIMSAKGRHTTIHLEFELENLKMAGT